MSKDKVIYDYYRLEDGGYDYEPTALLKNGEIERMGDSGHDPYFDDVVEAIVETAKEYAGDRIVFNDRRVTHENVDTIPHKSVREEFESFLQYIPKED